MDAKDFVEKAVTAVVDYSNSQMDATDKNGVMKPEHVFIVWMCKTLQNNKAMLSTTFSDGMYFEFTWNGNKQEGYLDAYKKWKNLVIK